MVSSWTIKNVNIYSLFNVHTKQIIKVTRTSQAPFLWRDQNILQKYEDVTFLILFINSFFLFYFLNFIYLFILINLFIYLFVFGCVGSSFLCLDFVQLRRAGATLHRGARASHYRGLSCCGAQAQSLWLTGPVVPRHVGSSQTRARTRVSCIGRQILNHCATREAPFFLFLICQIVLLF